MFQHYCVINIKKNQDKKNIQGDSGEGLNIFAGERIGHCGGGGRQFEHAYNSERLPRYSWLNLMHIAVPFLHLSFVCANG